MTKRNSSGIVAWFMLALAGGSAAALASAAPGSAQPASESMVPGPTSTGTGQPPDQNPVITGGPSSPVSVKMPMVGDYPYGQGPYWQQPPVGVTPIYDVRPRAPSELQPALTTAEILAQKAAIATPPPEVYPTSEQVKGALAYSWGNGQLSFVTHEPGIDALVWYDGSHMPVFVAPALLTAIGVWVRDTKYGGSLPDGWSLPQAGSFLLQGMGYSALVGTPFAGLPH